MNDLKEILEAIWKETGEIFGFVAIEKMYFIACLPELGFFSKLGSIVGYLVKNPQYFLPFLAVYGTARALRLYNSNAIIQSHKRYTQAIIDKLKWHKEDGLEGNIEPHEISDFLKNTDDNIRALIARSRAIEWNKSPNLSEYGIRIEDKIDRFRLEIESGNRKLVTKKIRRKTQEFIGELIIALEQYGGVAEQTYMLSPRIFKRVRIWMFSEEFLESQNFE